MYFIAFSFLPVFKREKFIDDSYYLDGGFYDLGPVNMMIKKGYKTIYLVKVHGIGIVRPYSDDANVKHLNYIPHTLWNMTESNSVNQLLIFS